MRNKVMGRALSTDNIIPLPSYIDTGIKAKSTALSPSVPYAVHVVPAPNIV